MSRGAERPVWSQRQDESREAYEALRAFLALGPGRTLPAIARQLGKQLSLMKRWSARHGWRLRATACDEHEQQGETQDARAAHEVAYQRRIAHAEQLERVAMAALRSLLVQDPETGETRFDRRLKPPDIAALMRVACRLLPTALVEPIGESDDADSCQEALGRLSQEDLELLLALLEGRSTEEASDDGSAG